MHLERSVGTESKDWAISESGENISELSKQSDDLNFVYCRQVCRSEWTGVI
jgi:hypothetical protein